MAYDYFLVGETVSTLSVERVQYVVVVIHKKNEGPIIARLKGVMCARGEYVTFADSDDWIDERTYEVLYNNYLKLKYNKLKVVKLLYLTM